MSLPLPSSGFGAASCLRVLLLVVLLPSIAGAQIVSERELELTKALFDNGKFEEALKRATEAMSGANFTDAQRVKLRELAGLSAFNLGRKDEADAHFLALLKLNPDYLLDPFAVSPPAIREFEAVRKANTQTLNEIRQQIALRADLAKREAAEKERLAREQEERRRRIEELTRTITVRTVEKRSFLLNFVPFGAGQFQQGRTSWGIAFALSEGVLAIASIISYFALESMFENIRYTWTDRLTRDNTGTFFIDVRRIPEARRPEAEVWRGVKIGTGIGFYAVWAAGIAEALVRYQGEVVTESKVAPPEPTSPPAPAPAPAPKVNLQLSPSGAGVGLTVRF